MNTPIKQGDNSKPGLFLCFIDFDSSLLPPILVNYNNTNSFS